MKPSPREMVIWLRGEWRVWKHGPLPTNLCLSRVTDDLADFVEQNRWRKLSEEKPKEFGQYLVSYITRDDNDRVVREIAFAHWNSLRGEFRVLEPVESWAPVVGPEEES